MAKKKIDYDLVRGGYGFRETFDAGFDSKTCQCDIEGTDIYDPDKDKYLAHVDWTTPDDIEKMTDDEFDNFLNENL